MKKGLKYTCVVILFTMMLFSRGLVFASGFNMTDEELDNAIKVFMEKLEKESKENNNNSTVDGEAKLERNGDTISFISNGESGEFKYDFSNDCRFYMDIKFTKSMTEEEAYEASSQALTPLEIGFSIISSNKGNTASDSTMYVLADAIKAALGNEAITYKNGIECAEGLLKAPISDRDLYRLEYTKLSGNADEIVIRTSAIIKTEEDFSVVKGALDNFVNDMFGDLGSSENNSQGTIIEGGTNNSDKVLPEAGIDINLINTLKISVVVASVAVIVLVVVCAKSRKVINEEK